MKEQIRFDSQRVRLRTGEYERPDKRYEYRYTVFGKEYSIYAKTLAAVREKETKLDSIEQNRLNPTPYATTVNNVYDVWKALKRGIRGVSGKSAQRLSSRLHRRRRRSRAWW